MAIDYRIYYSDGTTYSGPVASCPIWEVLLIVERDRDNGRKIVSSGDFYTYTGGRWMAVDYFGMMQYLARDGMEKRVLVGVMVDSDKWNAAMRRAYNDPDFPKKTGHAMYEHRMVE